MTVERYARPGEADPLGETKWTLAEAFQAPPAARPTPPAVAAPLIEPAPLRRRARTPWGFVALLMALLVPATVALMLAVEWLLFPGIRGPAAQMKETAPAAAITTQVGAHADDLPSDAVKRIKEFEDEAEAIRKKADAEINARHDKLIADLEKMKTDYTKAGDLDAALAIRGRIQQLQASADKARNLLVNGSFEEGSEIPKVGDAFNQLENGSTALTGWVVSQGNINVVDSAFWKAADGKRSLDVNGSMPGAISQTFKTKKGQKYRVTFALAGNPGPGPKEKRLRVSAAGKEMEFTFDATGKTPTDMGWVTKTWEFTAESDETALEFLSLTEGADGPALDDVVVAAIGE